MRFCRFFVLTIFILGFLSGCKTNLSEEDIINKAQIIHEKAITVDTHCDTPMYLLRSAFDIGIRNDSRQGGGKVDLPRMKEGGLDAMFFAVFLGQGERTPEANEMAKERAIEVFDAIYQNVEKYTDLAEIAYFSTDARKIEKTGKRAIYIGIENGYPIGNDISLIKKFYDRGARYITLCHTSNNDICDSSTDRDGPEHNGLSSFGEEVVKEMNRLGMLIDVSHISDSAFYDVLELSQAPIIASHSSVRAVCDNPRNLNDDMLIKLAQNGGVIQICILSSYVKSPDPNPERDAAFEGLFEKYNDFEDLTEEQMDSARSEYYALSSEYPQKLANCSDLVDHIDYVVDLIGIDYVGIGTDFDGGGGLEDCFDVSEMGNITIELVRRGYSRKDINKIWGENFLRVFREVENLAEGT